MTRYVASKRYLAAGCAGVVLSAVSGWFAFQWAPSAVPTVLFLVTTALLLLLALRPPIEIHSRHLRIGNRLIPWPEIQAVDRTGWISPLVLFLTLEDGSRVVLIYPGDLDSARRLLNQVCRLSREALIDGVPQPEFFGSMPGEPLAEPDPPRPGSAQVRYPLLRAEDEAEVERLFQRLKVAGHLDSKDEN